MGYDITEEIDQKCEDLYGHTDWKFGKNNEVIMFPEARICYLVDKHFDCSCGDDDEAIKYDNTGGSDYDELMKMCKCDECKGDDNA